MTYTGAALTATHTALSTAVGDAGTAITALKAQMDEVTGFIDGEKDTLETALPA